MRLVSWYCSQLRTWKKVCVCVCVCVCVRARARARAACWEGGVGEEGGMVQQWD